MKIGLLFIATGRYTRYITPLVASARQYFFREKAHEVSYFVFTNSIRTWNGVTRFRVPHLPWPLPTLMRFDFFCRNEDVLRDMDYLYYCDVDMLFIRDVGEEVIGDRVATLHAFFYNKLRSELKYEDRENSTAYVPREKGASYYAGGFFGGRASCFLDMARELKDNIEEDTRRGITAIWHDESHLNRFFAYHPPDVVLSPSYCFPEGSQIDFPPKLVALNKDHQKMRGGLTLMNRVDLFTRPLRRIFG